MDWPNHKQVWREWREALNGPRMHHGWILAGKAGLGKRDFAFAAARELVMQAGVPQPTGEHPDIISLTHLPKDEKEAQKQASGKPYEVKRNITIAQIRAMQQRLTTRPTLGARRAVIIHPADDMERSASNALLKSLEEPPQGTFFLLVTHRPSGLLPTIRSRCRLLRFAPLDEAAIARLLEGEFDQTDADARAQAVAMSGGSLGAARAFLRDELGPVAQVMQQLAREGDPAFALRGQLADAIGPRPDRDRLRAVIDLARTILARELDHANTARQGAIVEAHGELVELSQQLTTFNFEPALLVGEIASLLARVAGASEPAHG